MPPAQTNLGQRSLDPQQGFGFYEEPRPQYLQALDTALEGLRQAPSTALSILDDPRNMWMGVGMPWLYHGTTAARARNILQKGFDPSRIGDYWSHVYGNLKGRSGPGVYFSGSPLGAKNWGPEGGGAESILRVFIPEKTIKTYAEGGSPVSRYNRVRDAQDLGFKAVRFPDEVVVPDPASIPLKNIRPFTGNPNEISQLELERMMSGIIRE